LATRSENRVPEYGVIFADASGVFWNQVDTEVSLNTIRLIQNRYDRIDFLLALWQPMLEMNYQMNMSLAFPYSMYGKILKILSLIQPRAVAPGSNGFKCIGGSAWMNQILFPVTRERFCQDVKAVCPNIGNNVFTLDPGDVLTIDNGEFKQLQGKCEFVTKGNNDGGEIDFSPVNIGNELVDPNADNYPLDAMSLAIEEEIGVKLPEFIAKYRDLLFIEHCHWQVIYQLAIVFPDGTRIWSFNFTQPNIEAKVGRNPLANLFTYMTASSLYGLLKRLKGMDYANLGGYYRRFQKLYIATPHGIIEPDPEEKISDPLAMRLPYNEIFKEMVQQEIARWSHLTEDRSDEPDAPRTLMMRMGNTLVKLNR
jgi:UDP-MurNAc hydroxylase